jgi:hypothetical protein
MRKEFVSCKDRRTAKRRCPWASVIVKAVGGYWCFESVVEAATWIMQR